MPLAIRNKALTLQASTTQTVTGNGPSLDLVNLAGFDALPDPFENEPQFALRVQLNVTASSGTTPSLTLVIQDSLDGVNWNAIGTFTAVTGNGPQVQNISLRGDAQPTGFAWPFNARQVRVQWTITGTTPSFTFVVNAVLL